MNLQSKRVLVTGADGFIGSHLVEHLLRAGAHVTALAQYNSFNFWGWLEDIPLLNQIQVVTGDIRDSHLCLTLAENVDVLFHLAALIPIPYSYRALYARRREIRTAQATIPSAQRLNGNLMHGVKVASWE